MQKTFSGKINHPNGDDPRDDKISRILYESHFHRYFYHASISSFWYLYRKIKTWRSNILSLRCCTGWNSTKFYPVMFRLGQVETTHWLWITCSIIFENDQGLHWYDNHNIQFIHHNFGQCLIMWEIIIKNIRMEGEVMLNILSAKIDEYY